MTELIASFGIVSETRLYEFADQPWWAAPARPTIKTASRTLGANGAKNTGTTANAQISKETFRAALSVQLRPSSIPASQPPAIPPTAAIPKNAPVHQPVC